VNIEVKESYTIGIPKAFTPNGDSHNDVIFVNGRGIKQLLEFSVYNRWGKKVFSTNNIDEGWDGMFDGKEQNVDTYTYYIKAEMWNDSIMEERGTFSLLR
jgi:gliding motility-associated-like protein